MVLSRSFIREAFVYGLIGVANTLTHFAVFWTAVRLTGSQTFANSLGFSIAVVLSFFLNAHFTFRKKPSRRRFIRMYCSMLLVSALFGAAGDLGDVNPLLTFVVYCVLNPMIGFLVTKYFVFKE